MPASTRSSCTRTRWRARGRPILTAIVLEVPSSQGGRAVDVRASPRWAVSRAWTRTRWSARPARPAPTTPRLVRKQYAELADEIASALKDTTSPTCRGGAFRRSSTPARSRTRSSARATATRPLEHAECRSTTSSGSSALMPDAPAVRPHDRALDRPDADREQAEQPSRKAAESTPKATASAPVPAPPRWNTSSP